MKALMTTIKSGENKGKLKFTLYGVNGDPIKTKSDTYESEAELYSFLKTNYPQAEIASSGIEEEEEIEQTPIKTEEPQKEEAPETPEETEETQEEEEPQQEEESEEEDAPEKKEAPKKGKKTTKKKSKK